MNIDIFNNKVSFMDYSDMILKDRILDIYQNYSLCDNECEYDKINIENMTVIFSCEVKTEINTEVKEPKLSKMFEDTFANSNIGVIRCY